MNIMSKSDEIFRSIQFQELQPVATDGSAGEADNILEFTIRLKFHIAGGS